jgi:hypothetical protein
MGLNRIISRAKRGQNFLEYTLLIIIVAAALTAMTVYITRAMNARMEEDEG